MWWVLKRDSGIGKGSSITSGRGVRSSKSDRTIKGYGSALVRKESKKPFLVGFNRRIGVGLRWDAKDGGNGPLPKFPRN